jgi:hypothetical protein
LWIVDDPLRTEIEGVLNEGIEALPASVAALGDKAPLEGERITNDHPNVEGNGLSISRERSDGDGLAQGNAYNSEDLIGIERCPAPFKANVQDEWWNLFSGEDSTGESLSRRSCTSCAEILAGWTGAVSVVGVWKAKACPSETTEAMRSPPGECWQNCRREPEIMTINSNGH